MPRCGHSWTRLNTLVFLIFFHVHQREEALAKASGSTQPVSDGLATVSGESDGNDKTSTPEGPLSVSIAPTSEVSRCRRNREVGGSKGKMYAWESRTHRDAM